MKINIHQWRKLVERTEDAITSSYGDQSIITIDENGITISAPIPIIKDSL